MNYFSTSKKKIIICGYPKSGNTWLTRLVAEMVDCPVKGFWYEPDNNEIAIEGEERESEFECYKTHYRWNELQQSFNDQSVDRPAVLYIVRDPRDVVVSVKEYFNVKKRYVSSTTLNRVIRSLYTLAERDDYDKAVMYLLKGYKDIEWLNVPWQDHVKSYLNRDVCIVKYEDLLENTAFEMMKIARLLSLDVSQQHIEKAIMNQSFDQKKKMFMKNGEIAKAQFLREGKKNQWIDVLNRKQIIKITTHTSDILNKLGYRYT